MPHRLRAWALERRLAPGQRLFSFSQSDATRKLRRGLKVIGVDGAELYTPKLLRAGKATEMAAQGFTLAQNLDAGEWKSRAVHNYIDVVRPIRPNC